VQGVFHRVPVEGLDIRRSVVPAEKHRGGGIQLKSINQNSSSGRRGKCRERLRANVRDMQDKAPGFTSKYYK
jgi:hypothetical protein